MKTIPRASFALALALVLLLSSCDFQKRVDAIAIEDIALSKVADGSYVAAENFFPVTAKVRVEVKAGRIEGIAVLAHSHGPKHGADALVARVIEKQSLGVDAISGSTYSSKVMLKAIEDALRKGLEP
jgi:uncharacterized protein with FMN-binding domain